MTAISVGAELPLAWMILTFGAERQWGGNAGYDDDATVRYRFDNFVPNHKRVSTGHLVLVRDRGGLIGVAKIGQIAVDQGRKIRFRCSKPGCGLVQIKRRATRSPAYRCSAGHEFDKPLEDSVSCMAYEAELNDFVPTPRSLSFAEMREACTRFNPQNAMQPIALHLVWDRLVAANPAVRQLVRQTKPEPLSPEAVVKAAQDDPEVWEKVARRIRRGQGRFRQELDAAYGLRCAITGHGPDSVLEAAHIAPHADTGRNVSTNGLLLRADIHALFDDGLLAIEPVTHRVALDQKLLGTPYGDLAGRQLRPRLDGREPEADALSERWKRFLMDQ